VRRPNIIGCTREVRRATRGKQWQSCGLQARGNETVPVRGAAGELPEAQRAARRGRFGLYKIL